MNDVKFEYDEKFKQRINDRQKLLSLTIAKATRKTIRRLIGSPVRFGYDTSGRRKRDVFRAWARSDGEAPRALNVVGDNQAKKRGGRFHLLNGLKDYHTRNGESWLAKMERGGRFVASSALIEYKANERAFNILKRKGFKS